LPLNQFHFLTSISIQPLISIVIPTYNRIGLLQKAIASVMAQTYGNWELVLVDDGSTDGTVQLISSWNHPKISIIPLQHTGHIGSLFNTGVRAGKGNLVAFLASDDVWLPDKLQLQVDTLNKNGSRWCYSNFELMNEHGEAIPVRAGRYEPLSGWIVNKLLTTEATITMCSVVMERNLFEEAGGFSSDPRLKYRGDYELALRVAAMAAVTALPDVLVRVLEHKGRSTSSIDNAHERTALAYEVFLSSKPGKELEAPAKKQQGFHLAHAATAHLGSGEYIIASRQIRRAYSLGADWKHCVASVYRGMRLRIAGRGRKR
jgi:glycosyltransferase involved in cell wall biosynthesis